MRALLALALVLACASPARAQQLDQSAPVRPAIRAKVNGVVKYIAAIDTNALRRIDARPDSNALEVEILATPKLCGVAIPEEHDRSPASTPAAPLRPIQRARYPGYPGYHGFRVQSPFAVRTDA